MSKSKQGIWSVTFVLVVLISFLGSINGNGVHNAITVLVEAAGGPATFSGFVTSAFSLTALVARFVAGSLSDKKGRRIVMLVGSIFLVAGALVCIAGNSIYLFLPGRILMGFGFSMVATASMAAIADIVPPNRLGEAVGYQGMAYAIAMAMGPAMGVALAGYGRLAVFGTFGGLSALCLVSVLLCKLPKPPASTENRELKAFDKTPERKGNPIGNFVFKYVEYASLKPAFIIFLVYVAMTLYMAFMSLYAQQEGLSGITIYFVLAAVTMLLVRLVFGKSFDKLSVNTLLIPSLFVGILGLVLPFLFNNNPALLASGVCYGVFCGFTQPLLTTDAIRRAPDDRRGAASATFYIGCDVGVTIGSPILGAIITAWGFHYTFLVGSLVLVIAIIASLILLRRN